MKFYRYIVIAFLFMASNANALEPNIELVEQFDNTRAVAFINVKDINQSPEWNPELSPPPLTIGGAINALKNFLKSSKTHGQIKEIELRQVPNFKNKWHYLIKISNEAMMTKISIFVVLLNGKVVPAMIEPKIYDN